ncbi:MAG: stage II sporulation protein M [Planctomycetes bacterium]|nr:stage II sporulation protein M [Planctomycetota bacterium]
MKDSQDRTALKSSQFRRERQGSWHELEHLLAQTKRRGLRSLSPEELARLPMLYHNAISSLSVARAISLDRALEEYLTSLVARAYVVVYACKRRPSEAVVDFFVRSLPRNVRRHWPFVAAAATSLLVGTAAGFVMTRIDPERFYAFVPVEMAAGRDPTATYEQLRASLYGGEHDLGELNAFAAMLFQNNTTVALLSIAVGFAGGLPSLALMFYNGLILGAMLAVFAAHGLGSDFLAWVLPHGVTELGAIVLCGAGGLAFGFATLFPGERTRIRNLSERGRAFGQVALGGVLMLFLSALLEGFFRQLVTSQSTRWLVAATMATLVTAYFCFVGREGGFVGREGRRADR